MRAANARAAKLGTTIDERERQFREDYADATEEARAATDAKVAETKPALDAAKEQRAALHDALTHATTAKAAFDSERRRTAELAGKRAEIVTAEKHRRARRRG